MIHGVWNKRDDREAAMRFLAYYHNVGAWEGVFEDATLPPGEFTLDERRLSLSSESHQEFTRAIRRGPLLN